MRNDKPFIFLNAVAILSDAQVSWTDLHVWSRAGGENRHESAGQWSRGGCATGEQQPHILLAFPPGAARTHVSDEAGNVFLFHSQVHVAPDSFVLYANYPFLESRQKLKLARGAAFLVNSPLSQAQTETYAGEPGGFVLTVPLHLYPNREAVEPVFNEEEKPNWLDTWHFFLNRRRAQIHWHAE